MWVKGVTIRRVTADEAEKLRRLGENPTVAVFAYEGGTIEVAASAAHRDELIGPFVGSASMSELDAAGAEFFSTFPTPNNGHEVPRP